MLLIQVLWGLAQWALGMTAQTHLGAVGVLLLLVIGASIRARHTRLAVGAAVLFALLMTQA
ncbi:hypothetical protein [Streptomyces sp. NPDC047043]|uniref:hypothetical protein n=1 Tax=Streptomyces sp. NPDC047043 TaxID=3154497 RepID=UPI0033E4B7AD